MRKLLFCCVFITLSFLLKAQLSTPQPFMSHFEPLAAQITDYAYKDTINAPFAIIRLPNRKLVYMENKNGAMQPFYVRGIETGYWDTRYDPNTDYEKVFADMKTIGANTAYVMIHWEDFEIKDNHFDFSFTDKIMSAAEKQNLKIKWVLFLHAQRDNVPSKTPETSWTFNLDNRDSCNYTMQWPKQNGEIYKNIKTLMDKGGIRPLHVYGHPEIFYRIRRMLYNLAVHYRYSSTVIGVQLGNEEGFSFLDESDYNPVTAKLFEEWKQKTNKTSYTQFKKEAIDWWWKQFTSAYHEGDPYKILSFNLDAGQAEANDPKRVAMTGTSAATYADGNLDVIGTMLYKNWGEAALLGLDNYYANSFNYQLPIFIPSEIGIGNFNSPAFFRHFVAMTLERAAQGLSIYCYGEVRSDLSEKKKERELLSAMFSNIKQTEDVIFSGLPGRGYAICTSENDSLKISHLHTDDGKTLALIYYSDVKYKDNEENAKTTLEINCSVNKPGKYMLHIYTSKVQQIVPVYFPNSQPIHTIEIQGFDKNDLTFVKIVQE